MLPTLSHLPTNSSEIKSTSYGVIKKVADVLKENSEISIKILGYTDTDGDATYNKELSTKRAQAVKDKLVNQFNINTDRITFDGRGEDNPIDSNSTAEGKANNRRVEFHKM